MSWWERVIDAFGSSSLLVLSAVAAFVLRAVPDLTQLIERWAERRRIRTAKMDFEARIQAERKARPRDADLELGSFEAAASGPSGLGFYISNIQVSGLRCFAETSFDLRHPLEHSELRYPNVNLILGPNGSGKSTALAAIAIAAIAPILPGSGFTPVHWVRQGYGTSTLSGSFIASGSSSYHRLEGRATVERKTDIERVLAEDRGSEWESAFDADSQEFFVAAYGAGRSVETLSSIDPAYRSAVERRRYQRIVSLFDERATLVSLGSWLQHANSNRQTEVRNMFRESLGLDLQLRDSRDGQPVFLQDGMSVPHSALSDGFRSMAGWLGDLLFHLDSVASSHQRLTDIGGIVLLDEVDLFLHPSWQRTIAPTLSGLLPNIQFIVTTHSPIVASTMEAGNVLLAIGTAAQGVDLIRIDEALHGRSAEQVLRSGYFDLDSSRPRHVADRLSELAAEAVNGGHAEVMDYLEALGADSFE